MANENQEPVAAGLNEEQRAAFVANCAAEVMRQNANLKKWYLDAFHNLAMNVQVGHIPYAGVNWPKPPRGYVVGKPDSMGFVYSEIGTDPVCEMPEIPVDPAAPQPTQPNNIHIGKRIFGDWFQALSDDTIQNGKTVPGQSADGVVGMFQKYGSMFGGQQGNNTVGTGGLYILMQTL